MARFSVTALGGGGDGIARLPDGQVCFIPGALPGEDVEAEVTGKRGDAALARLGSVLQLSAERVPPPCPHFGSCGGCTLQHWATAPYAEWKRAKLVDALARAGFEDAPVGALQTTPPATRRRADLAIRRGPQGVQIGFHAPGSDAVVPIETCVVLDPRLTALLAPLRALLHRLPALKRDGSAVLNLLDTGPDLLLRTDGLLDAAGRIALAGFATEHHIPRIAWATLKGMAETAAQNGPSMIRFGTAEVAVPPGAFLQASPAGEAAIRDAVLAALPKLAGKARIAELYAGLGTLSFALAARAPVQAFEGAADAVAALAHAAGNSGARIAATRRDLVRQPLLVKELQAYPVVVLDPPYAGAAEQVALLARARVPRVIYVSCNPAALARDAKLLQAAGYRVAAATPVDQFLWSPHLEAVVSFTI